MEKIDLQNLKIETWRDSNPFLPNWIMAKCSDTDSDISGIGFSPDLKIAEEKAKSEYLERFVFRSWCKTKINPFSNKPDLPPTNTTGFSAHPQLELSIKNAYFEFLERLALHQCSLGSLKLKEVQNCGLFPASKFFFWAKGLKISTYSADNFKNREPKFAFVTCSFKNKYIRTRHPGFLFGSAVSNDLETAKRKALEDALRTAPIVLMRDTNLLHTNASTAHLFWLSEEGASSLTNFVNLGIGANGNYELPEFSSTFLQSVKVHERIISLYLDKSLLTAVPFSRLIPLV